MDCIVLRFAIFAKFCSHLQTLYPRLVSNYDYLQACTEDTMLMQIRARRDSDPQRETAWCRKLE